VTSSTVTWPCSLVLGLYDTLIRWRQFVHHNHYHLYISDVWSTICLLLCQWQLRVIDLIFWIAYGRFCKLRYCSLSDLEPHKARKTNFRKENRKQWISDRDFWSFLRCTFYFNFWVLMHVFRDVYCWVIISCYIAFASTLSRWTSACVSLPDK